VFGVCKIRSADATTTGKRSASSRFRALGAPIVSRGARQLPLITRGIGRRRETRHSVAPRIHALSVHRVVRQPVLRSGVLPADLLHNGRVVVWLLRLLRECGNCDGHGYGRCDDQRATPTLDIEAHSIISRRSRVAWHSHDAVRRTRAGARLLCGRDRRGWACPSWPPASSSGSERGIDSAVPRPRSAQDRFVDPSRC
jgi:hypothetical protein